MKLYPFFHCAILLLLFSCNKTCLVTPQPEQQIVSVSALDPSNDISSIATTVIDTVVPDNAVSVKKFGALGNGVVDDSNALQAALNAENVIVLPTGTYIINKTITLKSGTKIYGKPGAIIKAGTNMKGTLQTLGRYLYISNANNCLVNNVKFQQSSQSFKFSKWANACIYLENSANTKITYNNFDFNLPYSNTGFVAIWVGGGQSTNTLIKGNRLISAGIEYAENGASRTIVDGNHITNSPADALVAHGNTAQFCTNNVITNNIIENAGYMGIEDWGNVDGSIIRNNKITGTGKNPANTDGIGISAVGVNTHVVSNTIADAQYYYIEVGGSHNCFVDSNIINDNKRVATGIFINFTAVQPLGAKSDGSKIISNIINNCHTGIAVFGDNAPNLDIKSNTINNPVFEGINIDSASPLSYAVNITDNNIQFNTPNKKDRKAIELYSSLAHGAGNQNITLNNNTITYATTADGGLGVEFGVEIGIDNTVLDGNKINGNNIKSGKTSVLALTSNGAPTQNVSLINNVISGATTDISSFVIKNQSGNTF
jgi:parallel beta-helix repeat protein